MLEALTILITAAIVVQLAVFATTIYLHRTSTHGALTLHPAAAWVFRFILWITTGITTREWVAVHRKHHAFTDEEGDPHSPKLEGFWSVQLGNVFHYLKALRNDPGIVTQYARDLKPDLFDRWLFDHGPLGLLLGITALCAVLGLWPGLAVAGIHAFLYVFVLSSSINGLCHSIGYKNFDNSATNIRLVAYLTGGEGLHNNHHGYQRSPKLSFKRSEFDPAWPIIKLLTALGLAQHRKTINDVR